MQFVSLEPTFSGRHIDTASLTRPIVDLRKTQVALAALVARLFEDLERRRAQLDQRARELRLARIDFEQAAARQQTPGILADADQPPQFQQTADQRAAGLSSLPCAALQAAESAERVRQLEAERGELLRSLEAARSQIGQLAAAALDLADLRAQVAALREELLSAQGPADSVVGPPNCPQLSELGWERRTLQAELDAVRRHAAELTEQLTECRRRFDEERSEWNAELRQLLRLLERQSQTLEDRLAWAAGGPAAVAPRPVQHEAAAGAITSQLSRLTSDLTDGAASLTAAAVQASHS